VPATGSRKTAVPTKSHRRESMCVVPSLKNRDGSGGLRQRNAAAPTGHRSNSCTCFSHPDFNCRYRNFTSSTVHRHPSRGKGPARGSRTVTAGSDLHRPRSTYVCCYSDTTTGLHRLFPGPEVTAGVIFARQPAADERLITGCPPAAHAAISGCRPLGAAQRPPPDLLRRRPRSPPRRRRRPPRRPVRSSPR
jgi:hypothetical protein